MTTAGFHGINIAPSGRENTRPFIKGWGFGLLVVPLLLMCGQVFTVPPQYSLGKLSDDPVKQLKELNQMADALAEGMARFGYEEGHERIFESPAAVSLALQTGELDQITTTLFEAADLMRREHAESLVVK